MDISAPRVHAERVTLRTRVAAELVVQLFSLSPPSWIRPALTLSALGTPAVNPRFALGPPQRDPSGAVTIPLTWSPDQGAAAFNQFTGLVVITANRPEATAVTLEGICTDGERAMNRRTLERVLRRIVRALEDVYPLSTPRCPPGPPATPPRASSAHRAC